MDELRIKKLSEPVTFTIRVDKSIVDFYDDLAGKTNRSRNELIGLALDYAKDKIIVEEYEGQKIDDIRRYDVDIFTVGSDWAGKFDYLNEYCKVVYLERTQGVSSTEIREQKRQLRMGLVGESKYLCKLLKESTYVNGLSIEAIYSDSLDDVPAELKKLKTVTDNLDVFINAVDAVYIRSFPTKHYEQIKKVLNAGKHVLSESPITLYKQQSKELLELAQS